MYRRIRPLKETLRNTPGIDHEVLAVDDCGDAFLHLSVVGGSCIGAVARSFLRGTVD